MSAEATPEDYYDQQTAADLLLFRNENNLKALRLEAPGIAKEFSDGSTSEKVDILSSMQLNFLFYISDPPGSLYYDNVSEFEQYQNGKDVNHRYKVTKYTNSKQKVFIIVKFSSDTKTDYALFKGGDARNALTASQMENHSNYGNWGELLNSNTPATLTKSSGQNNLTLSLSKVQRVANWTDTAQNFKDYTIDIKGSANFKDLNTLSKGTWARCNHDRAVFYESDYLSKDLIAWVLAALLTSDDIPGPSDSDTVFSGVVWSTT